MLLFIFALLLMLVMAGIIALTVSFGNESPDTISDSGAIVLSDELATGGIYSDHIPGGWTFVPNISPEAAGTALNNATGYDSSGDVSTWPSASLLDHRTYLEGVSISDSWRGWFDYNDSPNWKNAENGVHYQHYYIDGEDCYCAAYIGHFECDPDIRSLTLKFHRFNGISDLS